MRLVFSASDYLNTDISDEDGHKLYTISTSGIIGAVTTIRKHRTLECSDVIGTITWNVFKDTKIWFRETDREVAANSLLPPKLFSSYRVFTGPDGQAYKWKMTKSNCSLRAEGSRTKLVKYHARNFGIMSPKHGPYLEVSPSVSHMLDYVIITFIYAEKISIDFEIAAASA